MTIVLLLLLEILRFLKQTHALFVRHLKSFNEQAFFHDLFYFDWSKIEFIPDVETAWKFFHGGFFQIVNKHAPFHRFRVKGRDNPWFSSELSCIIHVRNLAWAKARKSCSDADWLIFRQLRNKCYFLLRKAKSEYFMSVPTDNLNDPRQFWKFLLSLCLVTLILMYYRHVF